VRDEVRVLLHEAARVVPSRSVCRFDSGDWSGQSWLCQTIASGA